MEEDDERREGRCGRLAFSCSLALELKVVYEVDWELL